MPWFYQDNPALSTVEVYFTGEITSHDLQEATARSITIEKEGGRNRFLIDTSKMEFIASYADLFDLPAQYQKENINPNVCIAVILSTSSREKDAAEFYKNICRNCGWQVRTFSERQKAIEWLLANSPPDNHFKITH